MIAYLLLPVMLISLVFYLYSVYRCRLRTRVVSKAITSLVFSTLAVVSCWAGNSDRQYFGFIFAALILCTFGDVFLEISRDDALGINYFIYALVSFFAAHVAFLFLFCRLYPLRLTDLTFTALIVGLLVLLSRCLHYHYLNMGGYVLLYVMVLTLMFVKSFSLIYGAETPSVRNILVAIGAGFFFVSSLGFSFSLFRRGAPRVLHAVNASVYYVGQTLIALSVLFAQP